MFRGRMSSKPVLEVSPSELKQQEAELERQERELGVRKLKITMNQLLPRQHSNFACHDTLQHIVSPLSNTNCSVVYYTQECSTKRMNLESQVKTLTAEISNGEKQVKKLSRDVQVSRAVGILSTYE